MRDNQSELFYDFIHVTKKIFTQLIILSLMNCLQRSKRRQNKKLQVEGHGLGP